ncbi:unnamed protein product [Effrenium voratum]|uniref:Uncharacterized protein n=1 Tax=Effrenium voratum TaxID=2562239 RepID=A0AA36IVA3_9DINO|nr:unnamed protein product [Effrenium voratum]
MRLALGSLLAQALALGPDSEGCDSEFWIWSRGILAGPSLPGEEDLGAVLRREAEVASSDNAGCRPGRFTLSVWQLVHSNATVRAWHLRKKFGVELVELPWAPLRAWRAFRALAELRRRALQDPKHLHPRLDSSGEPPEKLVSAVEPGGRLAGLLPWAAQALSADRAEAPESPAVAAALWILASKGTPQEAEELLAEGEQHAKTWALSKAWPLHHFLLERWPLLELLRHLEDAPVVYKTLAGGDPREPQCRAKEPYAPSVLSAGLESQRVEAVVVYGRKDRVEILCRYLVRNLRINGGVIDKVHFVVHAAMREDMDYLQELISAHAPHFAYPAVTGRRLAKFYSVCTDPETIYLKMDDDMVYLADEAVPEMVRERMRNRCGLVSANVINHAILSAVHQETSGPCATSSP